MSALLDALGFVGNVLDTPGSILRGLMAGDPGRAFSGVLDPSQRVSGRDMLQRWGALGENEEGLDTGDVGGFLAEVVTDPLNLLGAGALRGAYRKAMGPMHPGGAEKITPLLTGNPKARELMNDWLLKADALDPAMQKRALGEIPPGSSLLGSGSEAVVFKTPDGDLLRLAPGGFPEPANIPQMRKPTRHTVYGTGDDAITAQRLPMADVPDQMTRYGPMRQEMTDAARKMRADIQKANPNLDPYDVYPQNIGKMGDEWKIIDPSAVIWKSNQPPIPTTPSPWRNMSPIIQAMAGHNIARTWPMMTNG